MIEQFVLAIVAGLVVGLFSGLLGIGGGTLMIPVFRLGFGLSAIASTATSLFTIIPTSIAGCITHIKNRTCIVKIGLAAGIAGACTSPFGVLLANNSPAIVIMFLAAVIIAYSAITMFSKAVSMPKDTHSDLSKRATLERFRREFQDELVLEMDPEHEAALAAEAKAEEARYLERNRRSITWQMCLKGAGIGLVAGFASGYVGVGGGFIMVPLFISLLGITMKQASGTSLIAVVLLATPGVITQCMHGNVEFMAGIAMAIGSIPGALIGASLIRYIPERKMRFLFGFFLLFAAIMLIGNELGMFA